MKAMIVYASKTGNTKKLAVAIEAVLQQVEVIGSFHTEKDGELEMARQAAVEADLIFCGYWTDKGGCGEGISGFLSELHGKKLALFGTMGMGRSDAYLNAVNDRVKALIPADNTYLGAYLCQGKMPDAVRARYEGILEKEPENEKMKQALENFDQALSHPDEQDLQGAGAFAAAILETI